MPFAGSGSLLAAAHILFATLWFGGAVYQVSIIGRTLMQAGPAAGGFLMTLARRGGIGKYFAIVGGLAILLGGARYGQLMSDPLAGMETFSGRGLWLTLGALVAVGAYLHGMFVNMPTEKKWLKLANSIPGAPTKDQAAQLQALGMRMGKNGFVSTVMLAVAMLLMLLSRVFV